MSATDFARKNEYLVNKNNDLDMLSDRINKIQKLNLDNDLKKTLIDQEVLQFKEQNDLLHSSVQNALLIQAEINNFLIILNDYFTYNFDNIFTDKAFVSFYYRSIDLLRFLKMKSKKLKQISNFEFTINIEVCLESLDSYEKIVNDFDKGTLSTIQYSILNDLEEIRSLIVSHFRGIFTNENALKVCFGIELSDFNKVRIKYDLEDLK